MTPKRRSIKRRSIKRQCQLCRKRLSKKIRINMHEMIDKKRFVSQKQAVAVSYSQIKRRYKECDPCFSDKKV